MKINRILIQKIDRILLILYIVLTCLTYFFIVLSEAFYNERKIYNVIDKIISITVLSLPIMYVYQSLKSIYGIIMLIIHRKRLISQKNEIDYLPYVYFIICMLIISIIFIFKISELRITINPTELLNSFEKQWAIYIPSMIVTTIGIPAWLIYIKNKVVIKGITGLTLFTTILNSLIWYLLLTVGD